MQVKEQKVVECEGDDDEDQQATQKDVANWNEDCLTDQIKEDTNQKPVDSTILKQSETSA